MIIYGSFFTIIQIKVSKKFRLYAIVVCCCLRSSFFNGTTLYALLFRKRKKMGAILGLKMLLKGKIFTFLAVPKPVVYFGTLFWDTLHCHPQFWHRSFYTYCKASYHRPSRLRNPKPKIHWVYATVVCQKYTSLFLI